MSQLVIPNTIDAGTPIAAAEHQQNYDAIKAVVNGQLEGGTGADSNIKANGVTARELADVLLLKGLPTATMQEGVLAANDFGIGLATGMQLTYAAGNAWITDDGAVLAAGALLPATVSSGNVTLGAAHGSLPRLDQIRVTLTGYNTGTVAVLAGTPTSGATLYNRAGAAIAPPSSMNIVDVLVPAGSTSISSGNIRDKRPHASGVTKGRINSDGSIYAGFGFTVSKLGTGYYNVNLNTSFAAQPHVLITSFGADYGQVVDLAVNYFEVVWSNMGSGQAATDFFFEVKEF